MEKTVLVLALHYLLLGISTFPLRPKDKRPAIPSWKEYQNRLPTKEELTKWFDGTDNNIAIVTGKISNLIVIDLDDDEAVKFAESKGWSRDCPQVKTGKGRHLYFKYQEGARNFQKRQDFPGIDLRAEGGYVVAPPSIHPSGLPYEWLVKIGECPLREIPQEILTPGPASKSQSTPTPQSSFDLSSILEKCAFLKHCHEQSASLSEELWWAMLSNVARISPGGPSFCHVMSRGYPKYSKAATDAKILQVVNNSPPHTCEWIKQRYACGKDCKVKAPAVLFIKREEAADIKARLFEMSIERGKPLVKGVNMGEAIIRDIERKGGEVIIFNHNQEVAYNLSGKTILACPARIDIFLRQEYGYMPSEQSWKAATEKIHVLALEKKNRTIHNYSTYQNDKIYIGLKNLGNLVISADGMSIQPQGYDDVYVQSSNSLPANFMALEDGEITIDDIFKMNQFEDREDEQLFLLKSWFYHTFFESEMRPILALIAPPGSGKTFFMKTLKAILFGFDNGSINPIKMQEEEYVWALQVKENKYLFIDEFNDGNSEMKTRLRMAATGQEMIFRPKYERNIVRFQPDLWLAVGAHTPKFRDNDIAQRLCLITLKPLEEQEKAINEYEYFKGLNALRPHIWAGMVRRLQTMLQNKTRAENEKIPLSQKCRLVEFSNFAYQTMPAEREVCIRTFNNISQQQSEFSAAADPLMDMFEEWYRENVLPINNDFKAKDIFEGIRKIAKRDNIQIYIKSVNVFGNWLSGRMEILKKKYGLKKTRNAHTCMNGYIFDKFPSSDDGMEVF